MARVSCLARVTAGVGGAIGGSVRAVYGTYEAVRYKAITTLKKGTNLLKYGRRGKPKFCPSRLSTDETVLVWFSEKEEKHLKLSHVSRIIPGQRTVEDLTRKLQLQEVELEKTKKQLKEAIAVAGEETAKCKAAKEVIKSLTAQLKKTAERLPPGAVRNSRLPMPASPGLNHGSSVANTTTETLSSSLAACESGLDGSSYRGTSQVEPPARNKTRTLDGEANHGSEWVEQDEPGVYITFVSLPGGFKDLKRVRFSRRRFGEKQAEHWWAANRARVYQQYNVPLADKSSVSVGKEGVAH